MKQNGSMPMKDQEMMHDSLSAQKEMTSLYNIYANECSTPGIRDEMIRILNEEHAIEADIFREMQKRGWYPTTAAPEQKIQNAKQKFLGGQG